MQCDVREIQYTDGTSELVLHGADGEQLVRFHTMDQMLDVIDVLIGCVESIQQAESAFGLAHR
ncbi:hypothetical protein GIY23_01925 [Allosaccharopolyspora coralli]|uniref:Uncharacterized protein n=1 Tax=Allosaccharopolyspora coralli TaxID=2665642 RepID=A0A5Q3QCE6_9PSEU|nr:hypothetical protein [Allosaccharopolyspora coralli]QGK68477.1 hypothetical protein GIY23_01925 [Allosaccharopolyspora coralli]